jgi:hypothetical protein
MSEDSEDRWDWKLQKERQSEAVSGWPLEWVLAAWGQWPLAPAPFSSGAAGVGQGGTGLNQSWVLARTV